MRVTHVNHLLQARPRLASELDGPPTVLVVEQLPFSADVAAAHLKDHGAMVVWCRASDGRIECAESALATCPLHGPVDLVLDVRAGANTGLAGGELGVACAGLDGIPVVAAGPVRPSEEETPWALARCRIDEAAAFCLRVLDHPQPWESLRMHDLVRRVVDLRGDDVGEIRVDLSRWREAVRVHVGTQRQPSEATCAAIDRAVRALKPRIAPDDVEVVLSFTSL